MMAFWKTKRLAGFVQLQIKAVFDGWNSWLYCPNTRNKFSCSTVMHLMSESFEEYSHTNVFANILRSTDFVFKICYNFSSLIVQNISDTLSL
jgi:hypothetical protein